MKTTHKTKYFTLVLDHQTPKTNVYQVRSKACNITLGWIRWFPPYRAYAFMPADNTIYDFKCMQALTEIIESLNAEQKKRKHGCLQCVGIEY